MSQFRPFIAYSQVHLAPAEVSPIFDPSQPMTLAQVTDDGRGLIVVTGIAMGPILVDVATATVKAEVVTAWEELQVIEMHVTEPLFLSSPTIMDELYEPVFVPRNPGPHTVTVQARGRATQPDGTLSPNDEPLEEFLIQFNPN